MMKKDIYQTWKNDGSLNSKLPISEMIPAVATVYESLNRKIIYLDRKLIYFIG